MAEGLQGPRLWSEVALLTSAHDPQASHSWAPPKCEGAESSDGTTGYQGRGTRREMQLATWA